MATTFGDVWRKVRLHAPEAPFGLVREWTLAAYKELCERRPWVFLQQQVHLRILAARDLTVTCTQDSRTVTSAAGFVASDVGRQLKVGSVPFYTISALVDASTVTLDLPYSGISTTATATICSAYVTLPADFGAFLLVPDLYNQRIVSWWHTQEELAGIDPTRTQSDANVRALVATTPSPVPATLGQMRYEWWPTPTTERAYPCVYRQSPQALADTDTLRGVLGDRGEILETGALMFCARWPGTSQRKNPYFSMATYRELKDDFEKDCAHLELRDDDQNQQSWVVLPYHRWAVWDLAGGTTSLRSSDATVGDYYPY